MVINGSDMMWFADGASIAAATSHTLTISADVNDTSNKDEGGDWGSSIIKKLNFEGKTENLFTDSAKGKSFNDLFDVMIAKTPIDAIFSIAKVSAEAALKEAPTGGWTVPTTGMYKGKIIITNLELNAPAGDNATYTATFKGVGALSRVTT